MDASETDVRNAALRADAGENDAPDAADTPETDAQTSPENPGQPAENGSDADSEKSEKETQKPAAKPAAKSPATDKPQAAKPESAYTKAAKDKARLDTSWKKLTEEKEAFRQEIARFEQQRAELLKQREQPAPKAPKPEENPEILESLAKDYESRGDEVMAQLARERAAHFRDVAKKQQEQKAAAPTKAPGNHIDDPAFLNEWKRHVADLVKENPTIIEPTDPVGRATMGLVNHENYGRFFRSHPDGIKVAHEVALLQRDAAQLKPLQEELTKAKAEVQRLTKLTAIRGGPPPSGSGRGKQALADLNGDAAEDFVRNAAMKADRGEST
jgi:uncharacterized protein YeeX (DUF496 family)